MSNYPYNMPYNPSQPFYNPQMIGYAQQQQTAQAAVQTVRIVHSEGEARNAQIPTDGNPIIFFDEANDKVYMKRFSFQDGSFPFSVYGRVGAEKPVQYATIDDLNALRNELKGVAEV